MSFPYPTDRMEGENILIDQLEDLIIDHPDARTREQMEEMSLDQAFQDKLNARADQITNLNPDKHHNGGSLDAISDSNEPSDSNGGGGGNPDNEYQFLIDRTHLLYEYRDYGNLDVELSEWFVFNDFAVLGGLDGLAQKYQNVMDPDPEIELKLLKDFITSLAKNPTETWSVSTTHNLQLLTYYGLGKYRHDCNSRIDQILAITEHMINLYHWGLLEVLIDIIESFMDGRISTDQSESDSGSDQYKVPPEIQSNFFRALTLFYFMLNVSIHTPQSFGNLKSTLSSKDILSRLVKFIEHWKWKPNSAYRIRSIILITWKLLLVELGDSKQLNSTEKFLVELHGIKKNDDNELECSPLDYFSFREDIMAKYPLYTGEENVKKDPLDIFGKNNDILKLSIDTNLKAKPMSYDMYMAMNESSNSLSNLIEIPKTNKSHTISSQLPTQTVHIATPVPSPPSTPSDYMSGGEKIRKLYQLNQAMPFIYPISDEIKAPYAIHEADEILKRSYYESYSNKQLWEERQKFMRQERGFVSEYEKEEGQGIGIEDENEVIEYSEKLLESHKKYKEEVHSLLRVESFYDKTLESLNSFIEVLVETIKSNKFDYDLNFPEWELNPETSCFDSTLGDSDGSESARAKIEFILMQQLEVLLVKEITLKASSAIILLLLQWFKKNHVLKYWYLSSLLFDEQYLSILMDFLNSSFNNNNLQQLKKKPYGTTDNLNNSNYDSQFYQNKILNPMIRLPKFEFFHNCLKSFPESHKYEFINKVSILEFPSSKDVNNVNNIVMGKYNANYCFSLANLLSVADLILLENKTQRILTLSDLKPSDMFKMILLNFNNEYFNQPMLKMLKKLIPYQGRKWKSNNMELISQVYLNSKLTLRDNWLSGKDLENDFNNSYGQEIAVRGLLQFYNMRRYPEQMKNLGYDLLSSEFAALTLNGD